MEARALKDILSRRGVFRTLAEMRKIHPQPMTAGVHRRVLNVSVETAADIRADLAAWGLIRVEEGYENKVPFTRMHLTPEGVKAADWTLLIEAEALKAKARHGKETDA